MKKLISVFLISALALVFSFGCKDKSEGSSDEGVTESTSVTTETGTTTVSAPAESGETLTTSVTATTAAVVHESLQTSSTATAASVEHEELQTSSASAGISAENGSVQSEIMTESPDEVQIIVTVPVIEPDDDTPVVPENSEGITQNIEDSEIIINDDGSIIFPGIPIEELQ